jgi:hypothetical protein
MAQKSNKRTRGTGRDVSRGVKKRTPVTGKKTQAAGTPQGEQEWVDSPSEKEMQMWDKVRQEEYKKQYDRQPQNREKKRERDKRYRANNKVSLNEYQKQYRATNKERIADRDKRYYHEHREKILEQQKQHH